MRFVFDTATSTLTVLHQFAVTDGASPSSKLLLASDANFYGTTDGGGQGDVGTLFMYSPTAGNFAVLDSFNGTNTGFCANGNLIQGSDGYIYGTTDTGGPNNFGTIFRF